jgi:N-glycosylase/DNA lyase
LDATLCCGQAFRWNKKDEWWFGIVGDTALKIRQLDDELEFENAEPEFVHEYLSLDDDLERIFAQIGKDERVKNAIREFAGLRILRQDPWECLVSYICATYKNIPAIKQMLNNLARKFGEKTFLDNKTFYGFPSPEKLAEATFKDLKKCGLGYRAKYLYEMARRVCECDFDFGRLKKEPYERAKEKLLCFPGVGLKVADCVLLFSLGKLEAFPVDVWIKRIVMKYYPSHFSEDFVRRGSDKKSPSDSEYRKLNEFGRRYFGEYAGYAQEYLYHYERLDKRSRCRSS